MSMRPKPIGVVPEDTARVARAAFPKGNLYMQMRTVFGSIYEDEDFSELFEVRGRPAIAPWRLALVTVMQFSLKGFRIDRQRKLYAPVLTGSTPWVSN
jgi:transposase